MKGRPKKDLSGQRFGKWLVLNESKKRKQYRMWSCRCDCGVEKDVYGTELRNGGSTRCRSCSIFGKRKPNGQASFSRLFRSYKKNANKHGRKFTISKEEARKLCTLPCSYCGKKPDEEPISWEKSQKADQDTHFNGIDRVDNKRGYEMGNVTTACMICNHAKSNLPVEVFMEWLGRIKQMPIINCEPASNPL